MNSKQAKRIRAALSPRSRLAELTESGGRRVSRGDFMRVTTNYVAVPGTERKTEHDVVVDLKVIPPFGSKIVVTTNTVRNDPNSPRGVYRAMKRMAR